MALAHPLPGVEIVPVFVPTLIIDALDGPWDFAYPGEFLVLDGMTCYKATLEQIQTYFVARELGQRDFS